MFIFSSAKSPRSILASPEPLLYPGPLNEWAQFLAAPDKWVHIWRIKPTIHKHQKCLSPQNFVTVFLLLPQWKSFSPHCKSTMQCKLEIEGQIINLSSSKTLCASWGRTPRKTNCARKHNGLTSYPAKVTHKVSFKFLRP